MSGEAPAQWHDMNWPCPYGFSDYVCFGHSGSPWSGAPLAAKKRCSVLRRTPLARILTLFRSPTLRQIIPPVAKLPTGGSSGLPFALNFKHVRFGSLADISERMSAFPPQTDIQRW